MKNQIKKMRKEIKGFEGEFQGNVVLDELQRVLDDRGSLTILCGNLDRLGDDYEGWGEFIDRVNEIVENHFNN